MMQPGDDNKTGLLKRSKELIDSAVSGLKGKDLSAQVDEYTAELTLVAEGLSEDLIAARRELAQLSASQTLNDDAQSRLDTKVETLQKRLDAMEKRLDKHQKEKATLSSVLRQVTVIAAIIGGAWVLTALLKLLGG